MNVPLLRPGLTWWKSRNKKFQSSWSGNDNSGKVESLTPILLSGGGRTGSTAIMALLGTDPRVAFDREYPFESRYFLYFVKFGMVLQRPDLFQFLVPEQVFDFNYIGFGGSPPHWYLPPRTPIDYLPHPTLDEWVREAWGLFSRGVTLRKPKSEFYAEKAPSWLAPIVREFMKCYTIYNLRDPRDIFISANAFMKKQNYLGFARVAADTDVDHARHIALALVNTYENFYADRHREDTMLLRYEDLVMKPGQVTGELQQRFGITAEVKTNFEFLPRHRTAKSIEQSVERWKSEPISEEVILFFERALRAEMIELGYSISHPEADACPEVSFAVDGIDAESLDRSSDGRFTQEAEYAVAHVKGDDFWVILPFEPFEAASVKEVWVSVKGEIGDLFTLYWQCADENFAEERCMSQAYSPSPQWTVLSFPVHAHPKWQNTILRIRLDLFNSTTEPHQGRGQIRWVRLVG